MIGGFNLMTIQATEPPVRPIIITCGEPAGVGAEIIAKAKLWRPDLPSFALLDAPDRLAALITAHQWPLKILPIDDPDQALSAQSNELPVLPVDFVSPPIPGQPNSANGPAVIQAIRDGVDHVLTGNACALVTNPIQKSVLYQAGFDYPGHTEFLAHLGGVGKSVMMLAVPGLRVVPITIHLPLAQVPAALSVADISAAGRITAAALQRDLGIAHPRLAFTGLNPHAGEAGSIGREEIEIIMPAIQQLQQDGIAASGPFAADSLFHADNRDNFDVAMCMYHDQALIPLKTIDFWRGVNITLGLPFIRTSPDHGTALSIAGTGQADPRSMIAAIETARDMARHRQQFSVT